MFAIGAGGLDVAVALAGIGFWIPCPSVVAVELRGALPDWVEAKDVVLELLRRHGTRGGRDKVFEFVGEGVSTFVGDGTSDHLQHGRRNGGHNRFVPQ